MSVLANNSLQVGQQVVYKDRDVCSVRKVHYGATGVDYYTVLVEECTSQPERVGRELQVLHESIASGKLRLAGRVDRARSDAGFDSSVVEEDEAQLNQAQVEKCGEQSEEVEEVDDSASFHSDWSDEEEGKGEGGDEEDEQDDDEEDEQNDDEDNEQEQEQREDSACFDDPFVSTLARALGSNKVVNKEKTNTATRKKWAEQPASRARRRREFGTHAEEQAEREWQDAVALERRKAAYRRALIEHELQEQRRREEREDVARAEKRQETLRQQLRQRRQYRRRARLDPFYGMRRSIFRDPFDHGVFLVHG